MEKSAGRLKLLAILVALMFAALSTRLWFLQVLASAQARGEALNNSVRIVQTEAPRGQILDDTGRHVLVGNRQSLEVLVNQQQLGADAEAVILRLAQVLKVPVRQITTQLESPRYYAYQPIPVALDVAKKAAFYIKEHQDRSNDLFPGVEVVEASVRQYPYGDLAAHVLGQVGEITAQQIAEPSYKNYGPSEIVGQAGLELTYERYLRGERGAVKYLVDSSGNNLQELGSQDPVPGNDVKLYLDSRIQRIAQDSLANGIALARKTSDTDGRLLKATSGAVVVMDPKTGGVVALASWPTFNPSWYVKGLSPDQSKYLSNETMAPLFDRAVQAALAPGSAFKPFIAMSALHNGIANLSGTYACPSTYTFPGDTSHTVFHNWDPVDSGYIPLNTALKISCDTVFYGFGGAFYDTYIRNPLGTGSEPLQRDLHAFGFGRDTGIDLPSEAAGVVPDASWKSRYAQENPSLFNAGENVWLPGDDINMAIGQGYVGVTPLQLATAYSAIANGGRLCEPRLAQQIQTPGLAPKIVKKIPTDCHRRLPYTQAQIDYVRNALATVPLPGGTAYYAFRGFPLSNIPVAGKTGTAQNGIKQDTSWFAAMVPANAPKYVVVAMVEQGGHGSTTAAPIVRSVIEGIYGLQQSGAVSGGAAD